MGWVLDGGAGSGGTLGTTGSAGSKVGCIGAGIGSGAECGSDVSMVGVVCASDEVEPTTVNVAEDPTWEGAELEGS